MALNLSSLLKLLPVVGPVLARTEEFVGVYHELVDALHPDDQAAAKTALAQLQAENDQGHARWQAKLAAAEQRT